MGGRKNGQCMQTPSHPGKGEMKRGGINTEDHTEKHKASEWEEERTAERPRKGGSGFR